MDYFEDYKVTCPREWMSNLPSLEFKSFVTRFWSTRLNAESVKVYIGYYGISNLSVSAKGSHSPQSCHRYFCSQKMC